MALSDQDKQDLTAMIDTAVKAAVEPIRGELEALKQAPAQATAEGAGEQPAGQAAETPAAAGETPDAATKAAENDDFKAAVLKRLDQIEEALPAGAAASKALPGQDGEDAAATKGALDDDRDGFGRRRRAAR